MGGGFYSSPYMIKKLIFLPKIINTRIFVLKPKKSNDGNK